MSTAATYIYLTRPYLSNGKQANVCFCTVIDPIVQNFKPHYPNTAISESPMVPPSDGCILVHSSPKPGRLWQASRWLANLNSYLQAQQYCENLGFIAIGLAPVYLGLGHRIYRVGSQIPKKNFESSQMEVQYCD